MQASSQMVHDSLLDAERRHLLVRPLELAGHLGLVPLSSALVFPDRLPLHLLRKKMNTKS